MTKRYKKRLGQIAIITFLLLLPQILPAQRWLGIRSSADTLVEDKKGFFLVPLVYYTPDTRWAFGASGVYYFTLEPGDRIKDSRLSYVQFLADYTQNDQLDLWSIWNIFTPGEGYLLKGEARFRNFPDRFYGIGNNTPSSNLERYSYDYSSVKALFMKRVYSRWFVGFDYHFENEFNFELEEGGILENGNITGSRGGIGSALGMVATFDSRDNIVNAHKGQLFEASSYFYRPWLGSTFNFSNLNFEYRFYHRIKKKHVIATQSRLRFNFGDVPFLDMNTVGDIDILRGYASNRFRDRNFWGTQTEYRFPIYKRVGGVAFAGVGDVYNHPDDLALNRLKYSVGTGLRFSVNPAERLNIRFDVAFGRGERAFYLMVTEAF